MGIPKTSTTKILGLCQNPDSQYKKINHHHFTPLLRTFSEAAVFGKTQSRMGWVFFWGWASFLWLHQGLVLHSRNSEYQTFMGWKVRVPREGMRVHYKMLMMLVVAENCALHHARKLVCRFAALLLNWCRRPQRAVEVYAIDGPMQYTCLDLWFTQGINKHLHCQAELLLHVYWSKVLPQRQKFFLLNSRPVAEACELR